MSSQTRAKTQTEEKKPVVPLSSDPALRDLQERYNMDAGIWKASQRGFPFNVSHKAIVAISLGIPSVASFLLIDLSNTHLWTTIALIVFISVVAFQLTEKVIMQFKESLENNGMFGKDLNKAGAKEDKPKV